MLQPEHDLPQVLAEIQGGHGLNLSAAGRMFPATRGAGNVTAPTVGRWVHRGARNAAGHLIRLEAVRVGCRWLTSRQAVARFVAALSAAAPETPARTPAARFRAADAAGQKLIEMGA